MQSEANDLKTRWNEGDSRTFIDLGRYFVPEREIQLQTICDLLPLSDQPSHVLELCCGEGLLAEAILERWPTCTLHGFDGSPEMLHKAQTALAHVGERFAPAAFDLADSSWRTPLWSVHAVVSSLAIHHLDHAGKQQLFADIHRMLEPGGALVIADVVQPTTALGVGVAAHAWDEAVRRRSLQLDGNTGGLDLFRQERWNMYEYPDPPEGIDKPSHLFDQLIWLRDAGFAQVDVHWMQAGHAIFGGRKAKLE